MRDSLIKFSNSGLMFGFILLLMFSYPPTGSDTAPPVEIEFVSSDQQVGGSEQKYVSRVDAEQVRGKPVWIVSWSDGVVKVLTPCVYEDGRRCYWDAGKAGNKVGDSFVSARGKIWYLNAYAL